MPSTLAKIIILACEKAKRQGVKIPKRVSLSEIPLGVSPTSPNSIYELDGEDDCECCPLGAVLLNSKHSVGLSCFEEARKILGVDSRGWISGFLWASIGPKPTSIYSEGYWAGWSVALEVLEWINNQPD